MCNLADLDGTDRIVNDCASRSPKRALLRNDGYFPRQLSAREGRSTVLPSIEATLGLWTEKGILMRGRVSRVTLSTLGALLLAGGMPMVCFHFVFSLVGFNRLDSTKCMEL